MASPLRILIVPGWRDSGTGHLNVESGHGEWPLGVALLQSLVGEGGLRPASA